MATTRRTMSMLGGLTLLAGVAVATLPAQADEEAFPPVVSATDPDWLPKDGTNSRRSMPAIFVDRWTEGGVVHATQILSYSNHQDGGGAFDRTSRLYYREGYSGAWSLARTPAGDVVSDTATGRFAEIRNVVKLSSGTLVAISAFPVDEPTRNADGTETIPFGRYVSTDHGKTWTVARASVTLNDLSTTSMGVFFQGIIALPDGRWVAAYYYGQDANANRFSVRLIVSAPGSLGTAWTAGGLIARGQAACPGLTSNLDKPGEGFSETALAPRPDGRLLAVIRCDNWTSDPAHDPDASVRSYLYSSVSSDASTFGTWSAPAKLTIPATAPGSGGLPTYGTAPVLLKAEPQSTAYPGLLLAFGRPGNLVAFNADGYGTSWTTGEETIAESDRWNNAPANHGDPDGVAPDSRLWLHHGSSGNVGASWLSYNQAIVVGDNCQADWGCWQFTPPSGAGAFPHGRDYFLWAFTVTY